MDENKVVNLKLKKQGKIRMDRKISDSDSAFATNPLIKEMLFKSINDFKSKFSIKDLFK